MGPRRSRLPGGIGWSSQLLEAPRIGPSRQRWLCVHRQLSEDLLLAREALEKESHESRRQLQQEKEELLYRVTGSLLLPCLQLASVTPLRSPSWPHRACTLQDAWSGFLSGPGREGSRGLLSFSQEGIRVGVRLGAWVCAQRALGSLGHTESPGP